MVARPEAVYFYSVDGRGPCFVFEGVQLPGVHTQAYVIAVKANESCRECPLSLKAPLAACLNPPGPVRMLLRGPEKMRDSLP